MLVNLICELAVDEIINAACSNKKIATQSVAIFI
jgi:hypothetical protein